MTCVAESVIDGIGQSIKTVRLNLLNVSAFVGGPGSQCKLDAESLKFRNPVLKKYLDADMEREVQALFALQHLMHRLEHPNSK